MQIVLGLIVVGLGGGVAYGSQRLVENFGRFERAERNVGGTTQAYVLFGFLVMILGFMILFGVRNPSEMTDTQSLQIGGGL